MYSVGCTEGMIRLINGTIPSTSAGRVELCFGGSWITICDRLWGTAEAQVVCRQLGFTTNDGMRKKHS